MNKQCLYCNNKYNNNKILLINKLIKYKHYNKQYFNKIQPGNNVIKKFKIIYKR